VNFNYI